MRKLAWICAVLMWCAMQPVAVHAQKPGDKSAEKTDTEKSDKGGDKKDDKKDEKKDEKKPEEKMVQTKHTIKIGGQEIKYTATAGTILLKLRMERRRPASFISPTRKTM